VVVKLRQRHGFDSSCPLGVSELKQCYYLNGMQALQDRLAKHCTRTKRLLPMMSSELDFLKIATKLKNVLHAV